MIRKCEKGINSMLLKIPELNISEDDPFAEDILHRKESAEILTELITSSKNSSFVLAIDSPWGTGKTTFLKMWIAYLKTYKIPTLYFNAWQNDFSDDALVSLIGEIEANIESLTVEKSKIPYLKKHMNKVKKAGMYFLKKALPVGLNLATYGLIDFNSITQDELGKLAQTIAFEQIERYKSSKTTILTFKKSLYDFAQELGTDCDENQKPLILFIDELDRCRPNYALEILEKAKHFFNIDNIIFVLAIDKTQIGHSLKSLYGAGMNVNGYLRRFIDLSYTLPKPDIDSFLKTLYRKFDFEEYFNERKKVSSEFSTDDEWLLKVSSLVFSLFDFSLRAQEQCFSQVNLVIKSTPKNSYLFPIFLIFLISLKNHKIDIYYDYVNGNIGAKEVIDYLYKLPKSIKLMNNDKIASFIEAYLIVCDQTQNDELMKKYTKENNNKAKNIVRLVEHLRNKYYNNIIGNLSRKIDITMRFKSYNN